MWGVSDAAWRAILLLAQALAPWGVPVEAIGARTTLVACVRLALVLAVFAAGTWGVRRATPRYPRRRCARGARAPRGAGRERVLQRRARAPRARGLGRCAARLGDAGGAIAAGPVADAARRRPREASRSVRPRRGGHRRGGGEPGRGGTEARVARRALAKCAGDRPRKRGRGTGRRRIGIDDARRAGHRARGARRADGVHAPSPGLLRVRGGGGERGDRRRPLRGRAPPSRGLRHVRPDRAADRAQRRGAHRHQRARRRRARGRARDRARRRGPARPLRARLGHQPPRPPARRARRRGAGRRARPRDPGKPS